MQTPSHKKTVASAKQIQYLLDELVLCNVSKSASTFSIELTDNIIRVELSAVVYQEANFDFAKTSITDNNIAFLENLSEKIHSDCNPSAQELCRTQANNSNELLKLIYFFSNERYLDNCQYDRHGRPVIQSIDKRVAKHLDLPITDILIQLLRYRLKLPEVAKSFSINFTCDFDILNIHTTLGVVGSMKRFVKAALKLRFAQLHTELISLLSGNRFHTKNPFLNDSMFHYKGNGKKGVVTNIGFLLVDHQHPTFDTKNKLTPAVHRFFQTLKKKGVLLGLHPAYLTMDKPESLPTQLDLFKNYTDDSTKLIRFHFLRCIYPRELRHLEANGFEKDFSFGFADSLAFRGGITGPFRMWDPERNCANPVLITPLTLMESTFFDYLHLPLEEAKKEAIKKLALCIQYGNTITLLWHNRSMYKYGFEQNYYPELLAYITDYLQKADLIG